MRDTTNRPPRHAMAAARSVCGGRHTPVAIVAGLLAVLVLVGCGRDVPRAPPSDQGTDRPPDPTGAAVSTAYGAFRGANDATRDARIATQGYRAVQATISAPSAREPTPRTDPTTSAPSRPTRASQPGPGTGPTASPPQAPPTAIISSPAPPASATASGTYSDPRARFSFAIPPGWRIEPAQQAAVVVSVVSDAPRGSANIAREDVTGTASLDDYVASTLGATVAQYPQLQVADAGVQRATISGAAARRFELLGQWRGEMVHITQYVLFADGSAYVLTFATTERDHAAFARQAQGILDSFRIVAR